MKSFKDLINHQRSEFDIEDLWLDSYDQLYIVFFSKTSMTASPASAIPAFKKFQSSYPKLKNVTCTGVNVHGNKLGLLAIFEKGAGYS